MTFDYFLGEVVVEWKDNIFVQLLCLCHYAETDKKHDTTVQDGHSFLKMSQGSELKIQGHGGIVTLERWSPRGGEVYMSQSFHLCPFMFHLALHLNYTTVGHPIFKVLGTRETLGVGPKSKYKIHLWYNTHILKVILYHVLCMKHSLRFYFFSKNVKKCLALEKVLYFRIPEKGCSTCILEQISKCQLAQSSKTIGPWTIHWEVLITLPQIGAGQVHHSNHAQAPFFSTELVAKGDPRSIPFSPRLYFLGTFEVPTFKSLPLPWEMYRDYQVLQH